MQFFAILCSCNKNGHLPGKKIPSIVGWNAAREDWKMRKKDEKNTYEYFSKPISSIRERSKYTSYFLTICIATATVTANATANGSSHTSFSFIPFIIQISTFISFSI